MEIINQNVFLKDPDYSPYESEQAIIPPVPNLKIDDRFAGRGFKTFEIDDSKATNSLAVIEHPAKPGMYLAIYHNGLFSGGSQRAGVTLFDLDGNVDELFGVDGSVLFQVEQDAFTQPNSIFADSNDNLVVYAESWKLEGSIIYIHSHLVRMSADGKLDHAFGNQGAVNLDKLLSEHFIPSYPDFIRVQANKAIPDSTGGYYIVGYLIPEGISTSTALIVRLGSNGEVDTAFGDDGAVIIRGEDDISKNTLPRQLMVQGDRLLCLMANPGDAPGSYVRAFTLDGEPDTTYGSQGVVKLEAFVARGFSLLPEDKLMVLGFQYYNNLPHEVACALLVSKSGEVERSFAKLVSQAYHTHWRSATQVDDRIYCLGGLREADNYGALGCYLMSTGEFDTTFGELGYGMPERGNCRALDTAPVLTPEGIGLIAGQWDGVAAVFAVSTQ